CFFSFLFIFFVFVFFFFFFQAEDGIRDFHVTGVQTCALPIFPVAGEPGRYRLGVRPYQLGARYAEHLDLAAEGQQVARTIAETCDETVHVAILEDTDVIYIAKVDSTHAVRMVSAAGRRLPAHCTSVGKMLLASLPEQELAARLPDGARLTAMT